MWERTVIKRVASKTDDRADLSGNSLAGEDLLNYYWRYFELQSSQRNRTCELYFSLLTALMSGYIAVKKLGIGWAEIIILFAILFNAIAFGIMFFRTTKLRNNARHNISVWEQTYISHEKERLFYGTKETRSGPLTYSALLVLQFWFVGIFSLVALTVCVCNTLPA